MFFNSTFHIFFGATTGLLGTRRSLAGCSFLFISYDTSFEKVKEGQRLVLLSTTAMQTGRSSLMEAFDLGLLHALVVRVRPHLLQQIKWLGLEKEPQVIKY